MESKQAYLLLRGILPFPEEAPVSAEVIGADGAAVYRGVLPRREALRLPLPPGRYQVSLRSSLCLNPGALTRWVHLLPGRALVCAAHFTCPLAQLPVCVQFYAVDPNYPGLTPINGGITVWQHRTTP